jgi:hypothetical protein
MSVPLQIGSSIIKSIYIYIYIYIYIVLVSIDAHEYRKTNLQRRHPYSKVRVICGRGVSAPTSLVDLNIEQSSRQQRLLKILHSGAQSQRNKRVNLM